MAVHTAEMWEQLFGHVDKGAHMKAMFELTTRMNSLARIVVGPANISATTALQVRVHTCVCGGGGVPCRHIGRLLLRVLGTSPLV